MLSGVTSPESAVILEFAPEVAGGMTVQFKLPGAQFGFIVSPGSYGEAGGRAATCEMSSIEKTPRAKIIAAERNLKGSFLKKFLMFHEER